MKDKKLARLTLDLPIELHRKIKIVCARLGKSMRTFFIEAIAKKVESSDDSSK